jgi:hypothetical protein
MPNLLKQLELEELSLVDRPANASAKVALYKRDNSQEDTMEEQVEKMSEDMLMKLKPYMDKGFSQEEAMKMYEQEMMKSEIETLKADNERLRKSLIENGFVIKAEAIEKKAEVEMYEVEGEFIVKSEIPAPILKALEAAKEAANVAKAEKEAETLRKRAEAELPNWDSAVAAPLLKSVDGMGEEVRDAVMQALKAADATLKPQCQKLAKLVRKVTCCPLVRRWIKWLRLIKKRRKSPSRRHMLKSPKPRKASPFLKLFINKEYNHGFY